MISVCWKKRCYICHCPLDVEVGFDDEEDEFYWNLCMDFVIGEERFIKNKLYWKKLGGHVYPACKSCFDLKFACNPAIIRDIETGKIRRQRPTPEGYTYAELDAWVDMCKRFIRRLKASDEFGRR